MKGLGWGIPPGQRTEPGPAPALSQVRSKRWPQSSAAPAAENRLHSQAPGRSGLKLRVWTHILCAGRRSWRLRHRTLGLGAFKEYLSLPPSTCEHSLNPQEPGLAQCLTFLPLQGLHRWPPDLLGDFQTCSQLPFTWRWHPFPSPPAHTALIGMHPSLFQLLRCLNLPRGQEG